MEQINTIKHAGGRPKGTGKYKNGASILTIPLAPEDKAWLQKTASDRCMSMVALIQQLIREERFGK